MAFSLRSSGGSGPQEVGGLLQGRLSTARLERWGRVGDFPQGRLVRRRSSATLRLAFGGKLFLLGRQLRGRCGLTRRPPCCRAFLPPTQPSSSAWSFTCARTPPSQKSCASTIRPHRRIAENTPETEMGRPTPALTPTHPTSAPLTPQHTQRVTVCKGFCHVCACSTRAHVCLRSPISVLGLQQCFMRPPRKHKRARHRGASTRSLGPSPCQLTSPLQPYHP